MKFLLVIILGGMGYMVYAQHEKIGVLQTSLDQSTAQVTDLQAKLEAEKAKAKQAAVVARPAATPNPLDSRASGGQQEQPPAPMGSSLLDRGHKGPLDH